MMCIKYETYLDTASAFNLLPKIEYLIKLIFGEQIFYSVSTGHRLIRVIIQLYFLVLALVF